MRKTALALLFLFALSACAPAAAPATVTAAAPTAETATSSPVPATATETPTPSLTPSPIPSQTPTPPHTPTPSVTPTYAVLRGVVNVEKVSCRYGPGAMYLYLYGMLQGATQDIVGRNQDGTWLLTQSRGDVLRCWVKADLMDISGDVMSVEPVNPHIVLPWSPYYGPLTHVSATRNGDEVRISWNALVLRAGDSSEQTPYVVETWVCQDGQLVFNPVGSYAYAVTVTDEPGCDQPSYGYVLAAEKHGYTRPVEIPWP
ncbi:MAG: hypothetical protein ACOYY3_12140 [Chloroflexota bacterium]